MAQSSNPCPKREKPGETAWSCSSTRSHHEDDITQHGLCWTPLAEMVTKAHQVQGKGTPTSPLDWRVSKSYCKRIHGMGDTVVIVFGKCHLPWGYNEGQSWRER